METPRETRAGQHGQASAPKPGLMARLKARGRAAKIDTLALYLAYKDGRLPRKAKIVLILTLVYAVSPIDLIPDFIPVIGQVDDLVIVPAGIALAVKLVPKELMDEYRERVSRDMRLKKSWRAGAVIVAIWIALMVLVAWLVWRSLFAG